MGGPPAGSTARAQPLGVDSALRVPDSTLPGLSRGGASAQARFQPQQTPQRACRSGAAWTPRETRMGASGQAHKSHTQEDTGSCTKLTPRTQVTFWRQLA